MLKAGSQGFTGHDASHPVWSEAKEQPGLCIVSFPAGTCEPLHRRAVGCHALDRCAACCVLETGGHGACCVAELGHDPVEHCTACTAAPARHGVVSSLHGSVDPGVHILLLELITWSFLASVFRLPCLWTYLCDACTRRQRTTSISVHGLKT